MDEKTINGLVATVKVALGDMIAYGEQLEIPAPMRLAMMLSLARGLARVLAEAEAGGAA